INLTAVTGNLGVSIALPLIVSNGASGTTNLNLSANAQANTIGNGNIWLLDNDADVGPLSPAVLLNAMAGSGTAVAQNGVFIMTETAGSIGIHPDLLSASSQIILNAQNNIIQLHGEVISAPVISLTATTGNIGVSSVLPLIVSSGASGATQLRLTLNAPGNTS